MARCAQCNNNFFCGFGAGLSCCWCTQEPKIQKNISRSSCFCSTCFEAEYGRASRTRCFRLKVAYLGTNFCGFQEQPNQRSVQSELKRALKNVTNLDLNLVAAGRTDSGVHAHGQVVSVEFCTRLTPKQLLFALSQKCHQDISVIHIDELFIGFNARNHSIGKKYVYQINQSIVPDPFLRDRSWHIRKTLNIEAMNQASQYFCGEHDFESFRSSLCRAAHARRYIWRVNIEKKNNMIFIDIRGNAFCMNMVRIMTGTLVEIGLGKREPENIKHLLEIKNRSQAGITAKPYGLSLNQVYYPDDLQNAGIPEKASFPRYPVSKMRDICLV